MSDARKNAFQLLGLVPAFTLDEKQLEANYLALQRRFHPDAVAKLSAAERQQGLQFSMDVNEAYQTLKSPLKRAQLLLSMQGIVVNSEKDTVRPTQHLLMQVMAWREALMEAESAEELIAQEAELKAIHHTQLAQLSNNLSAQQYDAAAQDTLALHYLEKTLAELKIRRKGLGQRSA